MNGSATQTKDDAASWELHLLAYGDLGSPCCTAEQCRPARNCACVFHPACQCRQPSDAREDYGLPLALAVLTTLAAATITVHGECFLHHAERSCAGLQPPPRGNAIKSQRVAFNAKSFHVTWAVHAGPRVARSNQTTFVTFGILQSCTPSADSC